MDGESPFQGQPAYVQKTSNKKRLVVIFVVVFLLIIAALGALYLLGNSAKHTTAPTNPIPSIATSAATPTPASASAQPSLTPEVSTSPTATSTSLSITVLNGSGTPGAAGQIATALKTAGYTDVTTGNAKAYTYTGITIYAKNKADLQQVQNAISGANANAKVTASVDATIPTDVEIIVGK